MNQLHPRLKLWFHQQHQAAFCCFGARLLLLGCSWPGRRARRYTAIWLCLQIYLTGCVGKRGLGRDPTTPAKWPPGCCLAASASVHGLLLHVCAHHTPWTPMHELDTLLPASRGLFAKPAQLPSPSLLLPPPPFIRRAPKAATMTRAGSTHVTHVCHSCSSPTSRPPAQSPRRGP